jgi:hypothetical protein
MQAQNHISRFHSLQLKENIQQEILAIPTELHYACRNTFQGMNPTQKYKVSTQKSPSYSKVSSNSGEKLYAET